MSNINLFQKKKFKEKGQVNHFLLNYLAILNCISILY